MMMRANGVTVAYRLEGPAEAPVVTLGHSLATSSQMWEPQVAALARDYRVLRYDTRGHGGSDVPPGPYSLEQLAEDIHDLLTQLGIEKTYFVGLSMGGMIAQAFALSHPQMLRGLVLCSTTARLTPDAEAIWSERIRIAQTAGMGAHVETTISRWFTPDFAAEHPEVVDPVRDLIRKTDPQGYVSCIEAIRHTDYLDQLAQIAVPTMVVVGRDDPGLPAAEAIHERIRGSELVVLSPAAHLCNLEQPETFNSALTGFLARAESQRLAVTPPD